MIEDRIMEPLADLNVLHFLVFADRACRRLLAAFAEEGDAKSYMHLHCPCSGVIIDRRQLEQPSAGE
jgi:hypothetical protein